MNEPTRVQRNFEMLLKLISLWVCVSLVLFQHHLLPNVPLCRFTLFTYQFRTVLVFVIVAKLFWPITFFVNIARCVF